MKELSLEQFTQYTFLHGVTYSPSGRKAAFVNTRCELASNGYVSELWLCEDEKLRSLGDISPSREFWWKDEGHILFLHSRSEKKTVFAELDIETLERRLYPPLYMNVKKLLPLDCGKYALIARINALDPDYYAMDAEGRAASDARDAEDEGFIYLDELPIYCNGDSYVNKKRHALFTADLETGVCRRITEPLFFVDYFAVEGDTVYYAGEAYSQMPTLSRKLYKYTEGDAESVCLYGKDGYNVTGLAPCSGKLIMFGNTNTRNGRRLHRDFYTVDKVSGEIKLLAAYPHNMRSSVISDCSFGAGRTVKVDGDTIYFLSTYGHSTRVMAADADGNIRTVLSHEGAITDFDVHDGQFLLVAMYGQKLQELYTFSDGMDAQAAPKLFTGFNEAVLDGVYVAEPQPLTFRSHGHDIEGWVLPPKDFDPDRSYPAILDIHGGPNFDYSTIFFHEMQLWANRGFFVFFCNPEGSEGHGDEFMNISGRYGREDYETLMAFTDLVLERYPQIDSGRLCVTGGSYGGFMTNWIVGHTDRFCCAATQRSISNWVSMSGTGDHSYHFVSDQMGAAVAENPEKIWSQSPLKYVGNVRTPVLVLHSTNDYRCPLEQGIQWFCALAKLGVETRMCIIEGESHGLSRGGRPRQRIRRLRELTKWMEEHTLISNSN